MLIILKLDSYLCEIATCFFMNRYYQLHPKVKSIDFRLMKVYFSNFIISTYFANDSIRINWFLFNLLWKHTNIIRMHKNRKSVCPTRCIHFQLLYNLKSAKFFNSGSCYWSSGDNISILSLQYRTTTDDQ